jgi:predicted phage tail protein
MIIASDNFTDPTVFVIVSVVNTLGIIMLMGIARLLSRDAGTKGEQESDRGDNRIFVDQRYMQSERARRPRITGEGSPVSPSPRA